MNHLIIIIIIIIIIKLILWMFKTQLSASLSFSPWSLLHLSSVVK